MLDYSYSYHEHKFFLFLAIFTALFNMLFCGLLASLMSPVAFLNLFVALAMVPCIVLVQRKMEGMRLAMMEGELNSLSMSLFS